MNHKRKHIFKLLWRKLPQFLLISCFVKILWKRTVFRWGAFFCQDYLAFSRTFIQTNHLWCVSWKHLLWWWCFKDNTFRKSNLILTFWKPFNSSCFEALSFFPSSLFFVFTTEKNWGLGGRMGHAPCPSVPPTLNMWVFITCTPEVSTYCKGFLNSAKCHLTRKWQF